MHIEFIDLLRCPESHEETWLVAAFNRMDGRDVVDAKLGCPVCGKEFFVRNGVGIFSADAEDKGQSGDVSDPSRIAAFLNLVEEGKLVLLAGELAGAAQPLADLTLTRVVALNGPREQTRLASEQVARIRADTRIPLAPKSLDGIAFDEAHSTEQLMAEASRLLRPKGRLLAPAKVKLSPEFIELARDENQLVAERSMELLTLLRKT